MAIIIYVGTIFDWIPKILFTLFSILVVYFLYNNKFSKYHRISNAMYVVGYVLITIEILLLGFVPPMIPFILISFAIFLFILASLVAHTVERDFFVYQLWNKEYKEFHTKVHEILKKKENNKKRK